MGWERISTLRSQFWFRGSQVRRFAGGRFSGLRVAGSLFIISAQRSVLAGWMCETGAGSKQGILCVRCLAWNQAKCTRGVLVLGIGMDMDAQGFRGLGVWFPAFFFILGVGIGMGCGEALLRFRRSIAKRDLGSRYEICAFSCLVLLH